MDRAAGESVVLITFDSIGAAQAFADNVRSNAPNQAAVGIELLSIRVVRGVGVRLTGALNDSWAGIRVGVARSHLHVGLVPESEWSYVASSTKGSWGHREAGFGIRSEPRRSGRARGRGSAGRGIRPRRARVPVHRGCCRHDELREW